MHEKTLMKGIQSDWVIMAHGEMSATTRSRISTLASQNTHKFNFNSQLVDAKIPSVIHIHHLWLQVF